MLLLHVSDIHFRAPDCVNPDLDPDRPFRTRMIQDARERTRALGNVDAILVGGDVAFKGAPQEYAAAFGWLEELARESGCPLERVFVVPGNHDVDRTQIAQSPATRNAQQAILRADETERERELRTQFSDPDTGRALLAPLAAYNDFAKRFNCQVYAPERLYWKQDLPVAHNVRLRIYGLTSTLTSGANSPDDTRGSLYLSPLQTVLDPVDDVVNLVMCHHPPDWFMDLDDVQDAICGRAAIQLFGHRHRQRVTRDATYIRFAAGAVNPNRSELGWQPSYNLVQVQVRDVGGVRALEIEAHLLEWQASPERFRPAVSENGEHVWRHSIALPRRSVPPSRGPETTPAAAGSSEPRTEAVADVEAAMSDQGTRNLVFRFWNLTTSQRREIALRMQLISADEMNLPEPERYGRALIRAGERGRLTELAQEVAQLETD